MSLKKLEDDMNFFNVNEVSQLKNGDVTLYLNHYWIIKDNKIMKLKRGSYQCNPDRNIVEHLLKKLKDYYVGCEITQIPVVCIPSHLNR